MKKYIVSVTVILLLIIVGPIWAFIHFSEWIKEFSTYGQAFTAAVLAFFEVLGIAIGILLIYFYFRRRAQHQFIFEGFCNEAELLTAEQKPINLSKLALEELTSQFQSLYSQLRLYTQRPDQPYIHHGFSRWSKWFPKESSEREDIIFPISGVPYDSNLASVDVWTYLPSEDVEKQVNSFKKTLEKMFDSLGTETSSELADSITDVAPKGMASMIKFFDMLISPRIVKSIGYLQYQSDKIGITIEIVDFREQSCVSLHTFWKDIQSNASGQPHIDAHDMSWVIPHYMELLGPAMRWLVLQIWGQKVSHKLSRHHLFSFIHHAQKQSEREKQKIVMYYLLGALYYSSGEQFPALHAPFFFQTAAHYLQKAVDQKAVEISWWIPRFCLANIYRQQFKQEEHEDRREKLFQKSIQYYDEADNAYGRDAQKELLIEGRILINEAKAIVESGYGDSISPLISNVKRMRNIDILKEGIVEGRLEKKLPATFFDKKQAAESIRLLYDFAALYEMTYVEYVGIKDARQKAWRYLAYSLARAQLYHTDSSLLEKVKTDPDFQLMREENEAKILSSMIDEIVKHFANKTLLLKRDECKFIRVVDDIIKEIDNKFG